MSLNESIVEDATLTWLGDQGYAIGHGPIMVTQLPHLLFCLQHIKIETLEVADE